MAALLLPIVVALGGGVIDWAVMQKQVVRLQAVADGAALAAAREMTLANTETRQLAAIIETRVKAASGGAGSKNPIIVDTAFDSRRLSVTVTVRQKPVNYFHSLVSKGITSLRADATARVLGTTRICALGLDRSEPGTVTLQARARMSAPDCAVFSNSSAPESVHAKNSSRLSASLTCSSGGFVGAESNFEPLPLTDCPITDDPLSGRAEPTGNFDCQASNTKLVLRDVDTTLSPGTYCGGLKISGSSFVRFEPGIYTFKDGPFVVTDRARIDGRNVGFYLLGNKSNFNFSKDTTIDLTAPEDGEMAGMLFFESRSRNPSVDHKITSNNARILLGTIYLPKSDLVVDGSDVVADMSAYTVIIARKIKLFDGPHLVLNADYNQTSIPVPDGIANRANHVGLVN